MTGLGRQVSTGDGHARMKSHRDTAVFRRLHGNNWIHLLKLPAARTLLNRVSDPATHCKQPAAQLRTASNRVS